MMYQSSARRLRRLGQIPQRGRSTDITRSPHRPGPDRSDRQGGYGLALVTDTIVVDHGKIVSEHLNSVIAFRNLHPAGTPSRRQRQRSTERFFRTVREACFQYLQGTKGPDVNARGLDVEGHAFATSISWPAIVRKWIGDQIPPPATRRSVRPGLPSGRMTPAQMFARYGAAGYIEALLTTPNWRTSFFEPCLGKSSLRVPARESVLPGRSPHCPLEDEKPLHGRFKNRWPIHIDPDDISRVYIRRPEHTGMARTALGARNRSADAVQRDTLHLARQLFSRDHDFIDDQQALSICLIGGSSAGMSPAERQNGAAPRAAGSRTQ